MNIPTAAKRVVVLEQFAHLDWDWLNFFPWNVDLSGTVCDTVYFSWSPNTVKPAATVYRMAGNLLQSFGDYAYSTCEIGFLRAFAEKFPNEFRQMVAGGRLTIVGGAITSPDNLLPPGEAFFRAFLTGLNWMDEQVLPWSGMVWIPDDFGHDSQLPVMLAAIGAQGVGFARVPGAYLGNLTRDQPQPMAGDILNQDANGVGGLDFWWKADDGSTMFAHWMPNGYSQGSDWSGTSQISGYLNANEPGSPSRYVHVPVANDFMPPIGGAVPPTPPSPDVLTWAAEWNASHPDDYALIASFADYVRWVKEDIDSGAVTLKTRTFHGDGRNADTTMFRSNPYFMGFYASRMEIKRLHNEAVRRLVAAEVLDAASVTAGIRPGEDVVGRFAAAWNDLAPSTHHDYITGTANDCVYTGEQLPLLQSVVDQATSLLDDIADGIVANLEPTAVGAVVLNTLGFARSGVVDLPNGGRVWGNAPQLGWNVVGGATPSGISLVRAMEEPGQVTLDNGLIHVVIRQDANWGITTLSSNGFPAILGGTGNTLSVWGDGGSIYSFGYECSSSPFSRLTITQAAGGVATEGNGSLRATAKAQLTLTVGGKTYPYVLQYGLTAGERYVEIAITGAAPAGTSVMVHFPFRETIAKIEHGTPYHWDWKTPASFGTGRFQRVFEPTHDFVLPYGAGGQPLGAIWHGAVPAWAIDDATLLGCILRNTPGDGCDPRGANGSDPDVHTITFALRVRDNLTGAATGLPLREARAYTNPLIGRFTASTVGHARAQHTVASSSPDTLITAIKRGSTVPSDLFLRVYKPGNDVTRAVVSTAEIPSAVTGATALERRLSPEEEAALGITFQSPFLNFTATRAVTTLKLAGSGAG